VKVKHRIRNPRTLKKSRKKKVRVNHHIKATSQQGNSNLQTSKDNIDRPIRTIVNGVTWVKKHEKSNQNQNDYIKENINEVQKLKKHRVLLLGDSHVRGFIHSVYFP
jgi:peptidoglycan hydrolase CwlO-like protein